MEMATMDEIKFFPFNENDTQNFSEKTVIGYLLRKIKEQDAYIKTITKGDKGDKGDKGNKGDKGDKGDRGEKGEAGNDASVILNFHDFAGDPFTNAVFEQSEFNRPLENGENFYCFWRNTSTNIIYACYYKVTNVEGTAFYGELLDNYRVTGAKGDKGDKGVKGDKGDKGDPGSIDNQTLMLNYLYTSSDAAIEELYPTQNFNKRSFNRTPELNDSFYQFYSCNMNRLWYLIEYYVYQINGDTIVAAIRSSWNISISNCVILNSSTIAIAQGKPGNIKRIINHINIEGELSEDIDYFNINIGGNILSKSNGDTGSIYFIANHKTNGSSIYRCEYSISDNTGISRPTRNITLGNIYSNTGTLIGTFTPNNTMYITKIYGD